MKKIQGQKACFLEDSEALCPPPPPQRAPADAQGPVPPPPPPNAAEISRRHYEETRMAAKLNKERIYEQLGRHLPGSKISAGAKNPEPQRVRTRSFE